MGEPLLDLLFNPTTEPEAIRDAVGALKNMAEYPKVRKQVDTWAHKHKVQDAMTQLFNEPIFDHKQWPASIRFSIRTWHLAGRPPTTRQRCASAGATRVRSR